MVLPLIGLILLGLAGIGAVTVIAVALVTFALLVDWFTDRAAQVQTDPDKMAVTVAEDIRSGNVSYIQGIFDTSTSKFTEARRVQGKDSEAKVKDAHSTHKVAIWS